jgi:hypothetical protein
MSIRCAARKFKTSVMKSVSTRPPNCVRGCGPIDRSRSSAALFYGHSTTVAGRADIQVLVQGLCWCHGGHIELAEALK